MVKFIGTSESKLSASEKSVMGAVPFRRVPRPFICPFHYMFSDQNHFLASVPLVILSIKAVSR